jgi:hypothetical protein
MHAMVVRQGDTKTYRVRLRGADRKAQLLPPGSSVAFSAWRSADEPKVIDALACVIVDDGTLANRGLVDVTFPAVSTAVIPSAVYTSVFNALVGGAIPLTFPDDNADPLYLHVTAQV